MEFRNLRSQYKELKNDIDASIQQVLDCSNYISGQQVRELEGRLAEYVGVKHCITCANGTDALVLALMAFGVTSDDAVFVPDFTFFSTAEAPASLGAAPIFVDVDRATYNIDPDQLEKSIERVLSEGVYQPKVVIAVDLFGLPADYDRIREICDKYGLLLLEDGAQGFGGMYKEKRACSFGDISTTSFFPAKPLGCYGDGGAIFTDNDEWDVLLRSLCVHGKDGADKYENVHIGMNSRLDTLQAAILLPKLKAFKEYEIDWVNQRAIIYNERLKDLGVKLPEVSSGYMSSWAQYTIQLHDELEREKIQKYLAECGIPTMVYYKKALHRQKAFVNESIYDNNKNTMLLTKTVLSLPISPYILQQDIELICEKISNFFGLN